MKALILDVESQETHADPPSLIPQVCPSPAPTSESRSSLDSGQGCFKPPS